MATFNFSNNIGTLAKTAESTSKFSADAAVESKLVFVDLDDEPAKANVLREGKLVPSVIPEKTRVLEALGGLDIVQPTKTPRVLNQSIEPGVRVTVGTTVDLVMAPRDDVNVGIFTDIHVATAETSIGQFVESIQKSDELVNLALKYEKVSDVSETDKNRMTQLLAENTDVQVNEGAAGQGFEHAFNSMQVALAFK